jgi:hypothetical protein
MSKEMKTKSIKSCRIVQVCERGWRGQITMLSVLAGLLLVLSAIPVNAGHLTDIADSLDDLCTETKAQIPEKYSDSAIDALEEAISDIEKVNGHNLEQYECKALNFIESAVSKTDKYIMKLEKLLSKQKVSTSVINPLIEQASSIIDALNHELPSGVASAENGARLYAENLCMLCHDVDGSGGVVGVNIEGKGNCDIQTAIMEEEVHSGITTTVSDANDLAAFLEDPGPLPTIAEDLITDPTTCRICHPRQYAEWQGNMMAYASVSPVFNALEALGNTITDGGLAVDSPVVEKQLFCQKCHSMASVEKNEFPNFDDMNGQPSRDFMGPIGLRGISCDVCHSVEAADFAASLLGDGIANNALILNTDETFGPINNPGPNPFHSSTPDPYLRSSEFCGTCHDVRPLNPDDVTGEPFQRLEDLFSEWQASGWNSTNNPTGQVVSCQDCHMDAGPPFPAGTYYEAETTVYPRPGLVSEREVSTHYFTGVDIALTSPAEGFPGQDVPGADAFGNPIGQMQRREVLLQSAATINLRGPTTVVGGEELQISVDVSNAGTGHNLPSGFSQERQCWVEVIVKDGDGATVYESGYLVDKAHPETGEMSPDGKLHDEDLENIIVELDPLGNVISNEHGPDYNQRHGDPLVNTGLRNFGNEFEILNSVTGEHEEAFIPFGATHMNNSFSLPPLTTEEVLYDVPLDSEIEGPLTITARLRFRPFPPRFLRLMAEHRPDLVDEALVDRNTIIEMSEAIPLTVTVQ